MMQRQIPTWLAGLVIILVLVLIFVVYAWMEARGKPRPVKKLQPPTVQQFGK